jgi:hypothetical protein
MTDPENRMEALWLQLWRDTSETQRFEIAMEMMASLRQRITSGVKYEHPEWSDAEVAFETFHRLYWNDLSDEQFATIRKKFLGVDSA